MCKYWKNIVAINSIIHYLFYVQLRSYLRWPSKTHLNPFDNRLCSGKSFDVICMQSSTKTNVKIIDSTEMGEGVLSLYCQKAGFSSGVFRLGTCVPICLCVCMYVLALPFVLIEYAKHEQHNKAALRQLGNNYKCKQNNSCSKNIEDKARPKNRITITSTITIVENRRQSVHN